ncbi:MAG TPA: tetraacyldisaccharide 4'-kinase [Gemmatimonadaceae bacterium]|nr:tetraacyldisaccharide 4'-kinase [Gemmatimonadaceae bacterium]
MADRVKGEQSRAEWVWEDAGVGARTARALLSPASMLFGAIVRARNALYTRHVLPVRAPRIPAVSIGNLSVGGTGKTPVSSWFALQLEARGAHPAIVMRGYGADEPLVHARLAPAIPVVVNANRLAGIERAASQGADVAVLDDAFQHRAVARVADVVLISADALDANDRLLPSGPYREPPEALRRASLVIVTRKAASLDRARSVASRARRAAPDVPAAIVHLALDVVHIGTGAPAPLASLRRRRVLAIAGVGNAAAFGEQLAQGGAVVRLRAYPDHYPFTVSDARSLAQSLDGDEIPICTLKDAVKLEPLWPREVAAIGYVSQAVIVEEQGSAIDAILDLVSHARLRQR